MKVVNSASNHRGPIAIITDPEKRESVDYSRNGPAYREAGDNDCHGLQNVQLRA